jgi:hypothetical protein
LPPFVGQANNLPFVESRARIRNIECHHVAQRERQVGGDRHMRTLIIQIADDMAGRKLLQGQWRVIRREIPPVQCERDLEGGHIDTADMHKLQARSKGGPAGAAGRVRANSASMCTDTGSSHALDSICSELRSGGGPYGCRGLRVRGRSHNMASHRRSG